MPPKDITETGPQTGHQLQQQNDEFTHYFGDYKKWTSYKDLRKQGFNDNQISRLYRNAVFKQQYGARLDFDTWAKSMTPEQRDNILIGEAMPSNRKTLNRVPGADYKEPISPFGPIDMQRVYNEAYQTRLAEEAVESNERFTPIENSKQAAALYKKLEREAQELYPDASGVVAKSIEEEGLTLLGRAAMARSYGQAALGEELLANPKGIASAIASGMVSAADAIAFQETGNINSISDPRAKRALYIQMNMKVPQEENRFLNISEKDFSRFLPIFSDTYDRYQGTYLIPKSEENIHQLYLDNKKYLDAGLLYRAKANIERYYNGVVGKYQPKGFKGDELIRGKLDVLLSSGAGAFVENTLNAFAVPIGTLEAAVVSPFTEKEFADIQSTLPTLTHKLGNIIQGDNAVSYGNGWTDAFFNSGVTFGAMASEAALAALTHRITGGMRGTSRVGSAVKKYGDVTNALMAGVREGTMDAVELREELLRNAEQIALTLPEEQRSEFLRNATHEANTAYGRTLVEEAAIVDVGTLMGLGFLGAINTPNAGARFAMKWQKNLVPKNNWAKWGIGAGHVFEKVATRSLGELLEEYGQGMASGINKARATDNINNYATALRYGLGSQYINDAHVGVLQGLFSYAPQAWAEMDPENLTKQVLVSTLLFNGVHIPGTGKTRQRIEIENNNKLGKLLDYIHEYSPIQTGLGEIASSVRELMHGEENALTAGLNTLIHDDDAINVLQTQAALADIGLQMTDAINNKDISDYQKTSAAYYAAQAVMLANALDKNVKFAQTYMDILNNRANISSLSPEEQTEMLTNIEKEVPNYLKDLSTEDKIKAIESVAKRSLDLVEQAKSIFAKHHETGLDAEADIRPLVFEELLNNLTPQIIKENWDTVLNSLNKVLGDSSIQNRGDEAHKNAVKLLVDNYFSQSDSGNRVAFRYDFLNGNVKGISKEDGNKVFDEVVSEISKEVPIIDDVIKADDALTKWKTDIYSHWSDMYQRVRRGEGTISDRQYNDLINRYKKRVKQSLDNKEKKYAERIKQSNGSVGQMASIMNQMISDEEIGKERAVQVASTQASPESIQEALKTLDAVKDLKDTIERITPADSPVREALPRLFDYIDARTSSVNSSADVLSLATYSSLNNPTLQALMAYAISEVGTQEAIPVTDAPVTKHDKGDLDKGTSTDASVEPEQEGAPLPNDETFEEKAPSTEQEVPEHQASTQVQEIEKWDNELSTIGNALNSSSIDPTTAGNQLYSLKQELENLYKKVSGDELRSRVKEGIDRATELIKIALALPSTRQKTVIQVNASTFKKKRRVIKTKYSEGLKAFKKNIVSYFREARQAKRTTTPEEFVDTFWNPSYENFDAVKEAFMELLPYNSRTEENAKSLFIDYFTTNKKLKTDRKGSIDISANEIVRRVLGIVSEEEAIKLAEGLSFKEHTHILDEAEAPDKLPSEIAQYTSPDFFAKKQTRAEISTLISEKKVIIDDTGDLVDAKAKWVAHKLKNGELPNRKNAVNLSAFLDKLESTYGKANYTELIQNFAYYGLPRYKELLRDEYNAYLSNSGVWDRIAEWQRADEEALDEMALQSYFAEQDAFENELNAQFLEELSRPVAIQIKLGNSKRTYDYATTNLDYEPGQTFQVLTQYGPTTATVVSYNKPIYSGTLKDLSTIIVPTREQAERRLQQFNDESKKRKHKDAVQNAFTSDTSRIADTHSEVLDVLKKDGAAQFLMRGNLHEGDELGFVLGTWQSPDGARPVVYIVTKKTYEHGSNDDSLFKGHQVIGVLDTDSATLDSKVYTEVNDIRQGLSTGDYFELKSNPLVVSNVSTSGVKVKSIIGEARDSKAVDETNLNKVLDSSNGSFGIEYDGKLAPITLISNKNGSIQSSNPNYDLKQLFDPSKSAEENAKRLIGNKADATLPENVTLMIVPTPSGDTAQLAVYAVDDTVEDFQSRLNNMLTSSPIGDAIKQNLKEKLMQLWRKSKKADVENVKFSLGTYFRLNGDGIVVTYFGGQFRFSLRKDTPLFAIPFDMADLGLASKSTEETEKLFDTTTVVDDCWNALLSGLTNPAQKIIRAVNLDVNNIASNPDILQQQIAAGALYVPNVVTGEDGKITLQNASFTAYTEDTKPVEKVSTKSKDATTPVISPNDNSSLVQQTESSSVISQPSTQPKSEGVSEKDVTPRSIISSRRKKKLKMSREISREPLESSNTNTSSVKSNAEISTMPYQEAIKYADITMDEDTWNSLGGIEKLQYLNCK